MEIWLDVPVQSSNDREIKSVPNNLKQEITAKPPNESVENHFNDNIKTHKARAAPINIKMEEPLMIDDDVESLEELPEHNKNPTDLEEKNLVNITKNSQCSLNDIGEIFKDAVPAKIDSPKVVKVKTPPVQQRKTNTLVKCLDKGEIFKDAAPAKIHSPEVVKLETPPVPVQQKNTKTLVKCLDSNGKVVLVEVQVDPNNPKNIKFIKTPTVIAPAQPTSISLAKQANTSHMKVDTSMEQKRYVIPATNILSNTSNSPSKYTKVNLITSTIMNPKQIIAKSNPNSYRLNPAQAKSLLENKNKKVYIFKSSALPNISSTNPPPLVRIANPNKVIVAPRISNLKIIQPTTKPNEIRKVATNSNNVIMKNGKIIVLNKTKPKQQSLLKPQVSLLKPVYQKQKIESTSAKSISIQKPMPRFRKQMPISQTTVKRDYHREFLTVFRRHRFRTVRPAVEYLLKNIPLINTLSSKPEFSVAFPFVTESCEKFSSFPFSKRRLNEVRTRVDRFFSFDSLSIAKIIFYFYFIFNV